MDDRGGHGADRLLRRLFSLPTWATARSQLSLRALRPRRCARQSERDPPPIFGFQPSSESIERIVNILLCSKRAPQEGVGLVVTPNIQHIAQLRRNPAFRDAYAYAAIILCDGFPVHYYALARGYIVNRITGCELLQRLLEKPEFICRHRLFFVIDSERTAQAVDQWAERTRLRGQVVTHVPPFGFEKDATWSAKLADEICSHSTTLLVMAVGAPRSEIFINQYRTSLPPCWAICVGQAVKTLFGNVQRAPIFVRRLNLEWLWRIVQEPRRLLPRYTSATITFVADVFWDLRGKPGLSKGCSEAEVELTSYDTSNEKLYGGDIDPGLGAGDGGLEVFGEAAIAIEPSEGAFDDPAAREDFGAKPAPLKNGGVGHALDDFDAPLAEPQKHNI